MSEKSNVKQDEKLHSLLRHDLRNKLQVSMGYLQLLKDIGVEEEEEKYVDKAFTSLIESIHIIQMVRNIRSVRNEEKYEVNLKSILDKAIEKNKEEAGKKDIKIKLNGPFISCIGGQLLVDAFSHIIENALKHSDCDTINIYTDIEKYEVGVIFEDDGKGVPEQIKNKIFDFGIKYGDNSGSGLGLSYVRTIVEFYEGSIEYKESRLGGASFNLKFKRV